MQLFHKLVKKLGNPQNSVHVQLKSPNLKNIGTIFFSFKTVKYILARTIVLKTQNIFVVYKLKDNLQ